ncbi:hypothetical protein [Paenibacillus terrae]|uniref:hypothetical protein n=1 Tax=Paenibacillus terrae TaxID=159743 RepID=UPI003B75C4A6
MYYYDEMLTPKKENAAWLGVPMQSDGSSLYSHTIFGCSQANVCKLNTFIVTLQAQFLSIKLRN